VPQAGHQHALRHAARPHAGQWRRARWSVLKLADCYILILIDTLVYVRFPCAMDYYSLHIIMLEQWGKVL
jgi:hypothetical protein